MGRHAPHLTVAPLYYLDLEPAGGDLLALADRRIAWPHIGLIHEPCLGGQCQAVVEFNPGAQGGQFLFARYAFHLHPVSLGRLLSRLGEASLQLAVVGEQQEPLAVTVQPAGGIDAGLLDVILEGLAAGLVGELAEHHVGLVQEQQLAIGGCHLRFLPGLFSGLCMPGAGP
ncbi:hypothetical protein LMBIIBHN_01351 [Aeromonas salmonicida]